LKILLFSHDGGGIGGASKSFISVIKGMKVNGHDLFIILPEKGNLIDVLEKMDIPYEIIPFKWWIRPAKYYTPRFLSKVKIWFILLILPFKTSFTYLRAILNIRNTVKEFKPDIIYTNTLCHPLGVLTSFVYKIKHVWHIREFVEEGLNAKLVFPKYFLNKSLSLSDFNIYISDSLADKYQNYKDNINFKIIANAVYSKKEIITKKKYVNLKSSASIKSLKILTIGRLSKGKGHSTAIRTIRSLCNLKIDSSLFVIGGGNFRPYLSLAEGLGVESQIKFLGHINNVDKYYRIADLIVVASKKEAFGRVVIEAMAHGVIVIGRNSGGIKDIIKHSVNGFLFKNEKDIIEIIQDIVQMDINDLNKIREQAYLDCLNNYTTEKLNIDVNHVLHKIQPTQH